jgi:hypothetical protein
MTGEKYETETLGYEVLTVLVMKIYILRYKALQGKSKKGKVVPLLN